MDRLVSEIETAERFCPYLSPLGGKEQLSSAAAAEVVGHKRLSVDTDIWHCNLLKKVRRHHGIGGKVGHA